MYTPNDFKEVISTRMQQLIIELGCTYEKIADACGISISTVEFYMLKKRRPSSEFLASICAEYNINPAWVMGLSDKKYL